MGTFEHQGVWWDPIRPEQKRVGTLRFDDREGALLTLVVAPDGTGPEPPMESYDVLHGVSTSGKRITLLNCFDQSTRGSFFGQVPRPIEVFVNEVVVGFHCSSTDPLLTTASASFRHLGHWWGRSGIEIDAPTSPRDISVRYKSAPPVVLLDDDLYMVSVTAGWTGHLSREEATVREGIHVEVRAKTPAPLSRLRCMLTACGDLLSVFCQRFCAIEELLLLPPAIDGQPKRMGRHYAVPVYTDRDKSYTEVDTLVTVGDVAARVSDVFSRWLQQADRLKDVRALYLSGVYGGGFVENKLIALTQAAEAFHRRYYRGEYMPADAFAADVIPLLKAAIPQTLSSGHRASLLARLTYGHEYAQRKRLKELFEVHEGTLQVLATHPLAFVNPMIDHRNAFTHFPELDGGPDSDDRQPEMVLRYNFLLKLLLDACFLQAAGLSTDEIVAFAQKSHRLKQLSARFFTEPAAKGPQPDHAP